MKDQYVGHVNNGLLLRSWRVSKLYEFFSRLCYIVDSEKWKEESQNLRLNWNLNLSFPLFLACFSFTHCVSIRGWRATRTGYWSCSWPMHPTACNTIKVRWVKVSLTVLQTAAVHVMCIEGVKDFHILAWNEHNKTISTSSIYLIESRNERKNIFMFMGSWVLAMKWKLNWQS
jgi:hypothetical protein